MPQQQHLDSFKISLNTALQPYLKMKTSLEKFGTIASELADHDSKKLQALVHNQIRLIEKILATEEAAQLFVNEIEVARAMKELESRFPDKPAFEQTLEANDLTRETIRAALEFELLSEAVLNYISLDSVVFTESQAFTYYEHNHAKFEQPERRRAKHILITINDQFPENRRPAALRRMQELQKNLNINSFGYYAERHSECPTAMNQGNLGLVSPGLLHAELDSVLFTMPENTLSDIVETEAGFHIILCEDIQLAHRVDFGQAKESIINQHNRLAKSAIQKNWIANLFS